MNSVLLLLLSGLTVNSVQSANLKKDSYEILEMRTEHQKVFKLSNGNYKYQIYSNPITHYHSLGILLCNIAMDHGLERPEKMDNLVNMQ
ncbi:MAG: hypothetical protein PUB23_03545 [Bacilli bacterium]|nr:hypothetical protein [Bacilli bacterium]